MNHDFSPAVISFDDEYYHYSLIIIRLTMPIVLQLIPLIDVQIKKTLIGSIKIVQNNKVELCISIY